MIKLIAFREGGWISERYDLRLWQHLAGAYGAGLQLVQSWDEAIVPDDVPLIGVDETGKETLDRFMHPMDAVYIFGRSGQAVLTQVPHDASVRIETRMPSYMFGVSAAAIVLEDRRRKRGRID